MKGFLSRLIALKLDVSVIGPENILFTAVARPPICQPRNFTGWGNEGVKVPGSLPCENFFIALAEVDLFRCGLPTLHGRSSVWSRIFCGDKTSGLFLRGSLSGRMCLRSGRGDDIRAPFLLCCDVM